jgi:hypothetical protein
VSIFNRRNALFGWLAWVTAKRVMKRKARNAVPGPPAERKGISAGAAAGIAAAVGGLLFWRRRRGGDAGGDDTST